MARLAENSKANIGGVQCTWNLVPKTENAAELRFWLTRIAAVFFSLSLDPRNPLLDYYLSDRVALIRVTC